MIELPRVLSDLSFTRYDNGERIELGDVRYKLNSFPISEHIQSELVHPESLYYTFSFTPIRTNSPPFRLLSKEWLGALEGLASKDGLRFCLSNAQAMSSEPRSLLVVAITSDGATSPLSFSVDELLDSNPERPDILLQAVIVPGPRLRDGTLIEAVAPAWYDIIRMIQRDPDLIFKIDARKWEEILAASYEKAGFDRVILTPRSADHGRDVIAEKDGYFSLRILDQMKTFKRGHLVTANDVRAMIGTLHGDPGATKAIVSTTSDFAPNLLKDPGIKPFVPHRLELLNGSKLIEKLGFLAINS